ncbi:MULTISPECIES: hypothetical protein [Sphingobacterium]|uniref:hypothetical protein n=1 Tax=Sphingobacterium TaxID=28453 RepID=UPI00257EEB0F|nr:MULTISPECIES: hypothetical protein [Sphingobacterium]
MTLLKNSFLLGISLLFASCSKEESEKITALEGSYSGKFTVYYKNQDKTFTGDVNVKFKADSFFCSTNKDRYPAGGSGTFEIIGNKIVFKDQNFWTADFDWALILNREYSYTLDGKELILTKDPYQNNSYTYKLKKD